MYAAGYKQKVVWVLRKSDEKISRPKFMKRFEELTKEWSSVRLSELFSTILSMIESGKEVRRRNGH
jgi:hypothetical protein